MKRFISLLLAVLLVIGTSSAFAETWTCPNCGRKQIDGYFCPDCWTLKPDKNNIRVGDYVYLGRWEQNGKKGDGAEKIRWLVLDVNDSKLFLLSDKALANLPFNKKSNGATWKDCSLRKWLNNDFYKGAFSSKEKAAIQTTKVKDNAEHSYAEFNTAKRFSGTTKDKVFLLSYLELCKYLNIYTAACEPTTVVSKSKNKIRLHTDGKHDYCYWWLRTSAYKNNAMFMSAEGFASAYEHHAQICVRPALWVEASAVTQ